MNFNTDNGENILQKVAKDERMINYNNLFSKAGNHIIKNFGFLKRFGTLYDFLIDLINEKTSTLKAVRKQNEMINKIEELKDFILLEEKSITNKNKNTQSTLKATTKTQRREIFAEQKSVLRDVLKMYHKKKMISLMHLLMKISILEM